IGRRPRHPRLARPSHGHAETQHQQRSAIDPHHANSMMPLMADPADTNAAIWKSEEVVKSFAAQAEQRERERAEQLTLVARLLPFAPDDAFTFVDLGAGTGAASRAILAEYPRASAILADYSRQMMAEGENQLAK